MGQLSRVLQSVRSGVSFPIRQRGCVYVCVWCDLSSCPHCHMPGRSGASSPALTSFRPTLPYCPGLNKPPAATHPEILMLRIPSSLERRSLKRTPRAAAHLPDPHPSAHVRTSEMGQKNTTLFSFFFQDILLMLKHPEASSGGNLGSQQKSEFQKRRGKSPLEPVICLKGQCFSWCLQNAISSACVPAPYPSCLLWLPLLEWHFLLQALRAPEDLKADPPSAPCIPACCSFGLFDS